MLDDEASIAGFLPGITCVTIIGVPAATHSCVVAPPALLMTRWEASMSSGMRVVQPSTSALPAVAATTASRKSASLPTVIVSAMSSAARLAASSTASRFPGLSISSTRGFSPARAEERGAK
jgi:hypothetical protein